MEFFERAHVSRKKVDPFKRENKSEEAVKKQLKQMLHAYKKGNNQEIKNFAVTEHKYDTDDVKSVSDYSDASFFKEAGNIPETAGHRARSAQSSIGQNSSFSNEFSSYISESENEHTEDSLESVTEFEFKSQSSSQEISSTDKDFTSSFGNSPFLSEYSEDNVSIPSSLQSSSGTSDMTGDGVFDPDGALATKILEKLGKTPTHSKKTMLVKEAKVSDGKLIKRDNPKVREILGNLEIVAPKVKKSTNKAPKNEELSNTKAFKVLEPQDITPRYKTVEADMSDNSFLGDDSLDDSLSSNNSSQFISVSALNMESQCLSDVIGDYLHPTVRNLPSEKQNIVYTQSSKHAILEEISSMSVDNIEEVSSLVPEIDEELAIEDLTLDTDAKMVEDSTELDDTVQTENSLESKTPTKDIKDSFMLFHTGDQCILVMKYPAQLYFHGKAIMQIVGGSVQVSGYTATIRTMPFEVFAPYCYFAHNIRTFEDENPFYLLFSKLIGSGLTNDEAERVCAGVTPGDAVLCISRLDCPDLDFVDDNFSTAELFSKRSDGTPEFFKKAAESLGFSVYLEQPKRVLEEKSSWGKVVSCSFGSAESKSIICGGKGTGKSTFLRYYVNKLLFHHPVLVIDLDPGQAEFTVPGSISVDVLYTPLIGPNFTHLRKTTKSLHIGMINPMDNPDRYMAAVKELLDYCKEEHILLPWVVNTMGLTNHMGLKFMVYIILQIQPTVLYQIDSKTPKKRFEYELIPETVNELFKGYKRNKHFCSLPPCSNYEFISSANEVNTNRSSLQRGNYFSLSAKDERYLNVLAYFGKMMNANTKSILDIVPYEVSINDINIGVNVRVAKEALTRVINGKIVALCKHTDNDKGRMFSLDDKALLCYGFGLIRGINYERGLLYVVTPLPIEELGSVTALVYADWMPELQGPEKELPAGTVLPYRAATLFEQRQLMFPPRRRFNPIQLLKVTRSS